MCSIFGYISSDVIHDKQALLSLSNLMKHRGEDSQGYFSSEKVFLGHNRLAIQDTSTLAEQPFWSIDKRYLLIFNGEIYNHQNLRNRLNHKFISNSDTETLLYLLIEYGIEILHELNGIFSFSFLDTLTGKLLIARDIIGVKPLYYQHTNQYFIFSSEIRSIIQHPNLKINPNLDALRNHLIYTFNPALTTLYEGVLVFPPGSYLEINTHELINEIIPISYSKKVFKSNPQIGDEKQFMKLLEEKLLEAVELQLNADVNIGLMLSGGLDSSAILALSKAINPQIELPCFTIKQLNLNKEGFKNDLAYARIVAKHFNQTLNEIDGEIDFDDLALITNFLEEPNADIAPIYTYKIAQLAKQQNIKVLLSGAGADEIFGGYNRHLLAKHHKIINLLPSFISKYAQNHLEIPFFRRLYKMMGDPNQTSSERQLDYFKWHHEQDINKLFIQPFEHNSNKIFLELLSNEKDLLAEVLNLEIPTYLQRHNLLYHDKMGMANGVEIRVPFLDLELLKFSKQIPTSLKVKGFTTKYIFRKVMEKYLPESIINRSKTGFGAPVRSIIKTNWSMNIENMMSQLSPEIFNLNEVKKMIESNSLNKNDFSYAILGLCLINNSLSKLKS